MNVLGGGHTHACVYSHHRQKQFQETSYIHTGCVVGFKKFLTARIIVPAIAGAAIVAPPTLIIGHNVLPIKS